MGTGIHSDSCKEKGTNLTNSCLNKRLESELGCLNLADHVERNDMAHKLLVELADCVVDLQTGVSDSKQQMQQVVYTQPKLEPVYPTNMNQSLSFSSSYSGTDRNRTSCSYVEMPIRVGTSGLGVSGASMEGLSEKGSCYHLNNNSWLASD